MRLRLIILFLLAFPLLANTKTLKVGDRAPDFTMYLDDGRVTNLYSFLNKGKSIVLYFYPKDETAGCTAQARNLRDNMDILLGKNLLVFGISTDDIISHQNFKKKEKLNFPLVADMDKSVSRAYGVLNMLGLSNRVTFIIRSDGIIEHIITNVDVDRHAQQILAAIEGKKVN